MKWIKRFWYRLILDDLSKTRNKESFSKETKKVSKIKTGKDSFWDNLSHHLKEK